MATSRLSVFETRFKVNGMNKTRLLMDGNRLLVNGGIQSVNGSIQSVNGSRLLVDRNKAVGNEYMDLVNGNGNNYYF